MKRLVDFPLDEGGFIRFEIDEPLGQSTLTDVDNPASRVVAKAQETLDAAICKIKPAAETILRQLKSLHEPTDEIEVSFGFKLTAEAGAIITSGSVEGNYSVTLKWKKDGARRTTCKPRKINMKR